MLQIDKVQRIEGTTIFGDNKKFDTFYLVPERATMRRTENGAPSFSFFKYRFPVEGLPAPMGPCLRSAMWTNVGIVAFLALLDPIVGWQKALTIHVLLVLPALSLGVWLFYIQHNFEESYWRRHEEWDYPTAALAGSSYYQMPRLLNWLTGDIAVHHVHHLSARIPNYRLREMMADHPELENMSRVGFRESFRYAKLTLWDEETQKMVDFTTAHERERERSAALVGDPDLATLNPPAAPSASEPA